MVIFYAAGILSVETIYLQVIEYDVSESQFPGRNTGSILYRSAKGFKNRNHAVQIIRDLGYVFTSQLKNDDKWTQDIWTGLGENIVDDSPTYSVNYLYDSIISGFSPSNGIVWLGR